MRSFFNTVLVLFELVPKLEFPFRYPSDSAHKTFIISSHCFCLALYFFLSLSLLLSILLCLPLLFICLSSSSFFTLPHLFAGLSHLSMVSLCCLRLLLHVQLHLLLPYQPSPLCSYLFYVLPHLHVCARFHRVLFPVHSPSLLLALLVCALCLCVFGACPCVSLRVSPVMIPLIVDSCRMLCKNLTFSATWNPTQIRCVVRSSIEAWSSATL